MKTLMLFFSLSFSFSFSSLAETPTAKASPPPSNWCFFKTDTKNGVESLAAESDCSCSISGEEVARFTAGQKNLIEIKDDSGKVIETRIKIEIGNPHSSYYVARGVRYFRTKELCLKSIVPFKSQVNAAEAAEKKREEAYK